MRARFVPPVSLVLLAGCAAAPAAQPAGSAVPAASPVVRAAATITADDVQRRVAYLASDELRGRDTPSPGLEAAARYAADEFRAMGLQPAGDSGTFIQRFPLSDTKLDRTGVRIETRAQGRTTSHRYGEDFFVAPSTADSVVGTPIFVGQARAGMMLPADVRGRIIIAFVPDTAMAAWQQAAVGVLQAAFGGGVSGVVLVLDPAFADTRIGMIADEIGAQVLPLPLVGMRYDVAAATFRAAGLDLGAIRTRTTSAATPLTGVTLAMRTPISTAGSLVPNIVAVLPGSDPQLRDEYIVYSAHIDHVGVGRADARGDSIFNGADDNASGSTALLEIAEAFAALERRPARSVMFVLVSGEEKGLLGSAFFVANPPVPTARMAANINMDMVGRNAPDSVVAIGQEYSSLGPTIQQVTARHPELRLTVAPDLWPEEQLFFRSDHFSFAAREVPAIFFTTGLHAEYHAPADEAHLIDNDKVARIARLLFHFGHQLADARERPSWTPEGLAEVRRHTSR